jgi:hypothetical protein
MAGRTRTTVGTAHPRACVDRRFPGARPRRRPEKAEKRRDCGSLGKERQKRDAHRIRMHRRLYCTLSLASGGRPRRRPLRLDAALAGGAMRGMLGRPCGVD